MKAAPAPLVVPRDAATVVVLRDSPAGPQALLLHRLNGMQFAGGEWVFPGGVVEAADRDARAVSRAARPDAATLDALSSRTDGPWRPEATALGLGVGGCRETFEESGILLARHHDGTTCSATLIGHLQDERAEVSRNPARFGEMLERHALVLALDTLAYWSNWVTPPVSPRRYDTRFFVAALPDAQDVDARLGEAQGAHWVSLRDPALDAAVDPPLSAPPTRLTLHELADLHRREGSVASMLAAARALTPVTVMLKVVRREERIEALFPWDDAYAATPGPGVVCSDALRQRLGRFPSRLPVDQLPRPRT